MKRGKDVSEALERVQRGGAPRYHEQAEKQGKLFCRERLRLLLDPDSFLEDAALANNVATDLPADGVVTGTGAIEGRTVCVMANDSTVKAGSWGARTVEKILRIQERAERLQAPLVYLVDSAGARITDQVQMFPAGAARAASSTTRSGSRACCRSSACFSAPPPLAGPISRLFAMWSSWWKAMPACTSAHRVWPRW